MGGMIVGAAGYIAVTLGPQAHTFPREYVIGYAAITCLGLVMVASGLRGARGMPRDLFLAFRAIAIPVAGYVAMMHFMPELWHLYLVRLFTVAVATGKRGALLARNPLAQLAMRAGSSSRTSPTTNLIGRTSDALAWRAAWFYQG